MFINSGVYIYVDIYIQKIITKDIKTNRKRHGKSLFSCDSVHKNREQTTKLFVLQGSSLLGCYFKCDSMAVYLETKQIGYKPDSPDWPRSRPSMSVLEVFLETFRCVCRSILKLQTRGPP